MIDIPYDCFELLMELSSIDTEKFSEEKEEKLKKEFECLLPQEHREKNKKIAEFHEISVECLVNSPNYEVLCEQYENDILEKVIKKITEIFEITEKQAWALFAFHKGLLSP